MSKLNFKEMIALWVKITRVDPTEDNRSYTIYLDGRLSDYDVKRMNDRIKESLTYDDTGLFAECYLKVYFKKFLTNKNMSLLELITNKDADGLISDIKTLYYALEENDAEKQVLDEARKAMKFYNLPFELDLFSVIELRTSALNCINKKLRTMQFSSGTAGDDFKMTRNIIMYKNLNALITCAAKGKINGVQLAYISDKKRITDSYFAFVIKNGDNLYLLTDMPEYSHPLRSDMSRCPGRDMSNRIESNWFPYDTVADINVSDLWGSGRYGTSEKSTKLSTVLNEESLYTVIGTIDSLSQDEAFWFIMMLSLIKDKFYDKPAPKLPISYVGEMINTPLIEKSENALIIQDTLPSLNLGVIDFENTKDMKYQTELLKFDNDNSPLIKRYKNQVNADLLNVISNTDKSIMIEDKYAIKDVFGEVQGCKYLSLDLNQAGTKEELEYKQKWLLRYNYATEINRLIHEDYERNALSIREEIRNLISARIKDLIVMQLQGKLVGHKLIHSKEPMNFGQEYSEGKYDLGKFMTTTYMWHKYDYHRVTYRFGHDEYSNLADVKCALTGKQGSLILHIEIKNADDLALVCGISKDNLPLQVQDYDIRDKYYGNPILNNIDPMVWHLKDEFNEMRFDINIALSKTEYKNLCKEAGVPVNKFW
jgi:hypothetical protein